MSKKLCYYQKLENKKKKSNLLFASSSIVHYLEKTQDFLFQFSQIENFQFGNTAFSFRTARGGRETERVPRSTGISVNRIDRPGHVLRLTRSLSYYAPHGGNSKHDRRASSKIDKEHERTSLVASRKFFRFVLQQWLFHKHQN